MNNPEKRKTLQELREQAGLSGKGSKIRRAYSTLPGSREEREKRLEEAQAAIELGEAERRHGSEHQEWGKGTHGTAERVKEKTEV